MELWGCGASFKSSASLWLESWTMDCQTQSQPASQGLRRRECIAGLLSGNSFPLLLDHKFLILQSPHQVLQLFWNLIFPSSLVSGELDSLCSASLYCRLRRDLTILVHLSNRRVLDSAFAFRRRTEAGQDLLHRVARRSGALSAGEISAVPNLINAYGQSACGISRSSKANPA